MHGCPPEKGGGGEGEKEGTRVEEEENSGKKKAMNRTPRKNDGPGDPASEMLNMR